jgi:hypothetical protein
MQAFAKVYSIILELYYRNQQLWNLLQEDRRTGSEDHDQETRLLPPMVQDHTTQAKLLCHTESRRPT